MKIQVSIENKLASAFAPVALEVENESHMHSVPANSETHFKVTLVTEQFEGKRKVGRHQAVYSVLTEELAGEVHALALHLFTPDEWTEKQSVPASPNCLGGSKQEGRQ